jgi:hypothetical protein
MQDVDVEVPNSKKYPLDEALRLTENVLQKGKNDQGLKPIEFFTFTGCYMVALAILMNYSRILVYGVDLNHTEEYRYQRECFAFWIGYAAGKGISLEIYGADSVFKRPMYGFETFTEFKGVSLSLADRINLLEVILPPKADLVTMQIVDDLHAKIGLTAEEIDEFKIAYLRPSEAYPYNDDGLLLAEDEAPVFVNHNDKYPAYHWLPSGNNHFLDVEIGEAARKVIQTAFKPLSESGNISRDMLSIYKKFVYE